MQEMLLLCIIWCTLAYQGFILQGMNHLKLSLNIKIEENTKNCIRRQMYSLGINLVVQLAIFLFILADSKISLSFDDF